MIRASEMKHRVSAKQGYTDTAPFAVQRVDGEKERRALKLLNKLDDDELNFLAGLESGELSQFIASKFAQKRVMRESYAPKTSTKLALCEERAMHERAASAMHDPRREYGDQYEYEGFDDDEDAGRERAEYIYAECLREAEREREREAECKRAECKRAEYTSFGRSARVKPRGLSEADQLELAKISSLAQRDRELKRVRELEHVNEEIASLLCIKKLLGEDSNTVQ